MSIVAAKNLSPSGAISKANDYFKEFFAESRTENVLLEELEFFEETGEWHVIMGFDVGRRSITSPNDTDTAFGLLASGGRKEYKPIRETRLFVINDSSGELVRMK